MRLPDSEYSFRHPDLQGIGAHDHHSAPQRITIDSTSQVISAGSDYDLELDLGRSDYQFARIQLLGYNPGVGGSGNLWRETCSVHAARAASDAICHSVRDAGSAYKCYSSTYSKAAGAAILSHKIFDTAALGPTRYIALKDAVISGSDLVLTFHNYGGISKTLWVKGEALVW